MTTEMLRTPLESFFTHDEAGDREARYSETTYLEPKRTTSRLDATRKKPLKCVAAAINATNGDFKRNGGS